MQKGNYGVFSCISYSNTIIETRFKKLELNKTLDIFSTNDKCFAIKSLKL